MTDTPRAAAERCDECHGCKSYAAGRAAGAEKVMRAYIEDREAFDRWVRELCAAKGPK